MADTKQENPVDSVESVTVKHDSLPKEVVVKVFYHLFVLLALMTASIVLMVWATWNAIQYKEPCDLPATLYYIYYVMSETIHFLYEIQHVDTTKPPRQIPWKQMTTLAMGLLAIYASEPCASKDTLWRFVMMDTVHSILYQVWAKTSKFVKLE